MTPAFPAAFPNPFSSLIPTFSQSNSHDTPTQGFWGLFSCRMKSRCIISFLTSILYFFGAPPLVSASQMQFSAHHTWLMPLLTGPSSQNATQCLLSCISWSHSKGVCCPLIQGLVATPRSRHWPFRSWGMRGSWGKRKKSAKVRGGSLWSLRQ